jgi:hypothetical protein
MARRVKRSRGAVGGPEPGDPSDGEVTRDDRGDELVSPGGPQDSRLDEEIRLRAYYRYLEREGVAGDEMSDWLEAESDVLGRHATGVDIEEKVTDHRGP